MKHKLLFIVLLFTTLAFSQQEASNWYFGENAGIKFHTDGSVTPLVQAAQSLLTLRNLNVLVSDKFAKSLPTFIVIPFRILWGTKSYVVFNL